MKEFICYYRGLVIPIKADTEREVKILARAILLEDIDYNIVIDEKEKPVADYYYNGRNQEI